MGHRTCGAVYLRGFFDRSDVGFPHFLWTENEGGGLREVHLLIEEPRSDPDPNEENGLPLNKQLQPCFLDKATGYVLDRLPEDASPTDFLRCWWPPLKTDPKAKKGKAKAVARPPTLGDQNEPWSWRRCGACGIDETKKKGPRKIEDHETTGEDPFANIVKSLFLSQIDARGLPPIWRPCFRIADERSSASQMGDKRPRVSREIFNGSWRRTRSVTW